MPERKRRKVLLVSLYRWRNSYPPAWVTKVIGNQGRAGTRCQVSWLETSIEFSLDHSIWSSGEKCQSSSPMIALSLFPFPHLPIQRSLIFWVLVKLETLKATILGHHDCWVATVLLTLPPCVITFQAGTQSPWTGSSACLFYLLPLFLQTLFWAKFLKPLRRSGCSKANDSDLICSHCVILSVLSLTKLNSCCVNLYPFTPLLCTEILCIIWWLRVNDVWFV